MNISKKNSIKKQIALNSLKQDAARNWSDALRLFPTGPFSTSGQTLPLISFEGDMKS